MLEGLGLCLGNENKNKTWQVFEQENIREENNGVLSNFIERKSYSCFSHHDAPDFCRRKNR